MMGEQTDFTVKLDKILEKQERVIEELFRHTHQFDLIMIGQEKTNRLLEKMLETLQQIQATATKADG